MSRLAAILALLLAACAGAPLAADARLPERSPAGELQLAVRKLASFTDVGDVSDLALLDPEGATLLVAEDGAVPEASLLVVQGSAARILVGYGNGLWEATCP